MVGGIRTSTGFLSKSKNLSKIGYVFEAKVDLFKRARSTSILELDGPIDLGKTSTRP